MLCFYNLITVIITMYPLYKSIKKVTKGDFCILHILVVVFWAMQVLPLAIENIFGVHETIKTNYVPMYKAMTDTTVGVIYCIFAVVLTYFLYFMGNKNVRKAEIKRYLNLQAIFSDTVQSKWLSLLLFVGMFLPLVAVASSPKPSVYFEFSYFYMNEYSSMSIERIYHTSVIHWVSYIALGSILLQYLYRKNGRLINNVDVLFAIFLMTWIDGKRALLTFALLGLLAIDILKKRYINQTRKLINKALIFAFIIVVYFVVYGAITEKGAESDFLLDYVMYYSRHSCVKVAIYDQLYTNEMLEYPGQSVLFDLLFFIPRSLWEDKPVLFCKYFTSYAIGYKSGFLSWNLHVNIWTEFIANFGALGVVLVILVVKSIVHVSVKSNNVLVYLFGTCFLVFYFMFGFETITQIMYIAWVGTAVWSYIGKKVRLKI